MFLHTFVGHVWLYLFDDKNILHVSRFVGLHSNLGFPNYGPLWKVNEQNVDNFLNLPIMLFEKSIPIFNY